MARGWAAFGAFVVVTVFALALEVGEELAAPVGVVLPEAFVGAGAPAEEQETDEGTVTPWAPQNFEA